MLQVSAYACPQRAGIHARPITPKGCAKRLIGPKRGPDTRQRKAPVIPQKQGHPADRGLPRKKLHLALTSLPYLPHSATQDSVLPGAECEVRWAHLTHCHPSLSSGILSPSLRPCPAVMRLSYAPRRRSMERRTSRLEKHPPPGSRKPVPGKCSYARPRLRAVSPVAARHARVRKGSAASWPPEGRRAIK